MTAAGASGLTLVQTLFSTGCMASVKQAPVVTDKAMMGKVIK